MAQNSEEQLTYICWFIIKDTSLAQPRGRHAQGKVWVRADLPHGLRAPHPSHTAGELLGSHGSGVLLELSLQPHPLPSWRLAGGAESPNPLTTWSLW